MDRWVSLSAGRNRTRLIGEVLELILLHSRSVKFDSIRLAYFGLETLRSSSNDWSSRGHARLLDSAHLSFVLNFAGDVRFALAARLWPEEIDCVRNEDG